MESQLTNLLWIFKLNSFSSNAKNNRSFGSTHWKLHPTTATSHNIVSLPSVSESYGEG